MNENNSGQNLSVQGHEVFKEKFSALLYSALYLTFTVPQILCLRKSKNENESWEKAEQRDF